MNRAWVYHNKPKKRWMVHKVINHLKETRSFYTEEEAKEYIEELRKMYPDMIGKLPGFRHKGYVDDRFKNFQRISINNDAEKLLPSAPRGTASQDEGGQSPTTGTTA